MARIIFKIEMCFCRYIVLNEVSILLLYKVHLYIYLYKDQSNMHSYTAIVAQVKS